MNKLNEMIEEYAYVAAKFGLNLYKGEVVFVTGHPENIEFIRLLVKSLYKTGAKRVNVDYVDDELSSLAMEYGDEEEIKKFYPYELEKLDFMTKHNSPRIYVLTESFHENKNVDLNKASRILNYKAKIKFKHREAFDSLAPWSVVPVPSKAWAKKLYPTLSEEKAMENAWKLFLKMGRVEIGKTLNNLKKHDEDLKKRCKYLNSLDIKELHYYSKNGTDLKVGLLKDYLFIGGSHPQVKTNRIFNPNYPTEEVFTSPDRLRVNGVVYSSKPLIVNGKEILDIKFEFKDGKIVKCSASKNLAILKSLISRDEGASYLGEAALVPFTSPINQANKIFYSTIFDENAVCHFAFGKGFPYCSKSGENKKGNELMKLGINESDIHIDFMIGTKDLNIDAITNKGKIIKIFKGGVWAKN